MIVRRKGVRMRGAGGEVGGEGGGTDLCMFGFLIP